MIRSLVKWFRLPGPDRWRTARLAGALLWIKATPRRSSIRSAVEDTATAPESDSRPDSRKNSLRVAKTFATALERAATGLPFSTSCLERSVVLQRALQKQGIPAQLRIGVRRGTEGLEAHAWVESFGAVLNDTEDVHERYSTFNESVLPAHMKIL